MTSLVETATSQNSARGAAATGSDDMMAALATVHGQPARTEGQTLASDLLGTGADPLGVTDLSVLL